MPEDIYELYKFYCTILVNEGKNIVDNIKIKVKNKDK